jgi:ribosomal protein S18 acetylase RimI-like enzyme
LRPATDADHAALYATHREALGAYVEQTWGPWIDAVQTGFFQAIIDRGLLQVIEIDGLPAGLLEVDDRFAPVQVQNIELAAAYQGQGIGTAVVTAILERAADRNVEVHLQVLKVNPAQRLYRRLGFVERGETETHRLMRWAPPPR